MSKKSKVSLPSEPAIEDLYIPKDELASLTISELRAANAALSKRLATIDFERVAASHSTNLTKLHNDMEHHQREYQTRIAALEKTLGVSFKDYAFDDVTGKLVFIGEGTHGN